MRQRGDLRCCSFDAIITTQEAGQSRSLQEFHNGMANEAKN
jgi:hypothetical protein